ncbi:MAG: dienelactone hydrolase [Rhodospirillales bacterium]|nr:dienelactone hydrolase [Rhodospirillales bacterium]
MRTKILALVVLAASLVSTQAGQPFRAGVARITVQDAVPFDTLIAYPTDADEAPFQMGPFTVAGSRGGTIAGGGRFPVVLFSHGNGRRGGTSLVHRDLVTSLAREGFIVIAPFHPGTSLPLEDRPRQIRKALDTVLADGRFLEGADPNRIGMIGFSFGGAVSLILAGAAPSLKHLSVYCRDRKDDPRACDGVPTDVSSGNDVRRRHADRLALKALVLMEPFGALFDREGLTSVNMPTLLYRAERSDLKADGNIRALADALPRPPQRVTVPGGHFIFVGPCPALVAKDAPEACKDGPGVDRAAVHRQIETEIADFLRRHL